MGADQTTIPQSRRLDFVAAALTFHDLRGGLMAIRQICADRSVLQREGMTDDVRGADLTLAVCVRRVCATAAASRDDAREKMDVLTRLKQLYHAGNGQAYALMEAMLDAAIAIETAEWHLASCER